MPLLKTRNEVAADLVSFARTQRGLGTKRKLPKNQPRWLFPHPVEREYERQLVSHVSSIGSIVENQLITNIHSLTEQRDFEIRVDDFAEGADRLYQSVILSLKDRVRQNKKSIAREIAVETNAWNDKEWQKQLRSTFGVDVFKREAFVNSASNSFVIENVSLITKMEDDTLSDIETILQRSLRQGKSSATIAKDILKRVDVARSRSRLIARDQVGKFNGQLTELRQTNLGLVAYTWRTSEDERVRSSHAAHNGKTFKWDDPPFSTGHPGQDIQCRCYAEPDFTPVFEEL